jgi:hypothetical protein
MKRRSLLIVVALLCMASLMAAMAFTSASVTSDAKFTVANSDEALLALVPGEHAAAEIGGGHPSNAQRLVINWDKGVDGEDFGIQPYSTYLWEDLFAVRNNSENPIHVEVYLDPDLAPVNVFFAQTRVADRWANVANEPLEFDLQPGGEEWINTKFESGSGMSMKPGVNQFKLMVDAVALDVAE